MVFDFYTKKIKVFVAEVSDDVRQQQHLLKKVLGRAGMEVLCLDSNNISDEQEIIAENKRLLYASDCSVHILGTNSNELTKKIGDFNINDYQFSEAQKRIKSEWRDFKIFIWCPSDMNDQYENEESDNLIRSLRQGIVQNMIFSNRDSVVLFVEDIRSVMYGGKPVEYDIEKTDLFFIYNWIDQDYANEIISMVSDVIQVKKLEIMLSADIDYSELVAQQIIKAKMVVIYFKNTSDWALPFVQQVWKKVGGASSKTPILFIGEANVESNAKIIFDAPQVISLTVPQEIMPVEIKVQFDKLSE